LPAIGRGAEGYNEGVLRLVLLGSSLAAVGCNAAFDLKPTKTGCLVVDDDCDSLVDDVDPCPADRGDDSDSDGDGVGDGCDPNQGVAVDSILFFEPFREPNDVWVQTDTVGAWAIDGSAFVESALGDTSIQRLVPANTQATVEALLDPEFSGVGSSVGVYVSSVSHIPLECRVTRTAQGDMLEMVLNNTVTLGSSGPLSGSGRLWIVGGQIPNAAIRCSARYGPLGVAVDFGMGLIGARANFDTIGLHVNQATAAFQSLIAYTVE
jgi:hypothetical protein